MKKIFYFIASAIVALGAVACQNDIEEGIDAGQQTEGFSIKVTIDEQTRVALGDFEEGKGRKLTFTEEDVLVVRSGWQEGTNYIFEYTQGEGDLYTFTCTDEGVSALVGTNPCVFYLGGLHEQADDLIDFGCICNTAAESIEGIGMYADTSNFGEEGNTITMSTMPLLKFTAEEAVTFSSDNYIFYANGGWENKYTTITTGDIYLPIITSSNNECTVTVTTESGFEKSFTKKLEENTIYNLGLIQPEVCNFGIVGAHQGWNTENMDKMYRIANSNTYAKKNVTLESGGFKFYGTTSEIVTIEHPAVTTGEEGDWYLIPNSNWKKANARFAIYFYSNKNKNTTWVSMKDENGDGIYVANNPANVENYTHLIFCRMNPDNTANNWDNKWNQTGDLTIPTNGNNCFSVPSGAWDGSTTSWSVHVPEIKDAWTEEVEEITTYWVGTGSDNGNSDNWVIRWSNNLGNDNITVTDTNKTYDIYFSVGEKQNWGGFEIFYQVLESGSEAPTLK